MKGSYLKRFDRDCTDTHTDTHRDQTGIYPRPLIWVGKINGIKLTIPRSHHVICPGLTIPRYCIIFPEQPVQTTTCKNLPKKTEKLQNLF